MKPVTGFATPNSSQIVFSSGPQNYGAGARGSGRPDARERSFGIRKFAVASA